MSIHLLCVSQRQIAGLWLYFVFPLQCGVFYSGASSCKAEKKSSVDFGNAFFALDSAGIAATWILPSSSRSIARSS
ncbi:MAG: hypothetical protein ACLTNY_07670, partial [Blautia massiliensis (ex Durand et al. 2017)]